MTHAVKKLTALLSSAVIIVGLSGCETNGTTRFSSVGQRGLQGPAGPQGAQGAQGPAGAGLGAGGAGALAVGGLVGPGGIAGTGLLANTGDPNSSIPAVSGVLVATGGVLHTVAGQGTILATLVDSHTPGGISLTGRVVGVVDATGQALIRAGNGQEYLVDGVTAATGQLVDLTVGNAHVLGSSTQSPLIGVSALSPTQSVGDALTVGVGSQGQVLTLGTSASSGGQNASNPVSGVVAGVTGLVPSSPLPATGSTTPATGSVQGVVETVTGLLKGPGSH
jgi:hypothetical protein